MIKNTLTLFVFLFSLSSIAQYDKDFEHLLHVEKRAGANLMNFKESLSTTDYDVKYHRLEWTVDPGSAIPSIAGDVTTYWEALADMTSITFDMASNLNVTSVMQRGISLSFEHSSDEISIDFEETQNTGVLDSLTITYSGNPTSSGFGSYIHSNHSGTPILWTLSEPYGAMGWWPCKQSLNDKIDVIDVIVTHPKFYGDDEYKTASNGLLQSEVTTGANKTTHWRHEHPIPAYLIAIAVTNYAVYNNYAFEGTDTEIPIVNYVYPEDLAYAESKTPVTADLIELYSDLFELYPYANEKYGHAQFGWGGGMEHTTMSFMGSFGRGLIAHELAHQWFGNKITCGSWEDIWLNEGFATYLEALSREHFDGDTAFISWRDDTIDAITNYSYGSVFCQDTSSVGSIFSFRLSYQKGAMVLHMLRYKLGDDDFYQGIKNYLADPELAFGYALTINLQEHLEAQSGMDLDEYFADWFMGEGYPSYDIEWDQEGDTAFFKVEQSQSHSSVDYFEMPLPIKVTGTGGETQWVRLENTENGQIFTETVDFSISNVYFDPNHELISRYNSVNYNSSLNTTTMAVEMLMPIENPVNGKVTLQRLPGITLTKINLYNTLGQEILEQNGSNATIDFSKIKNGVVILKVETNKGKFNKTLIVNN